MTINLTLAQLHTDFPLTKAFLLGDGTLILYGDNQVLTIPVNADGSYDLPEVPPLPTPVYSWEFTNNLTDEVAGLTLDFSPPGQIEGITYAFTDNSGDLYLQGLTPGVLFLSTEELNLLISDDFSLSAWIESGTYESGTYMSLWSSNGSYREFWVFASSASTGLNIFWGSASSYSSSSSGVSQQPLGAEPFYHLTVVRQYQNSDAITRVYLNNNLVGNAIDGSALLTGTNGVANNFGFEVRGTNGIDRVRIFGHALSAAEINELYGEG